MFKIKITRVEEAYKLYINNLSIKEIAEKIGVKENTVYKWKSKYNWGNKPRKRGAPKGNQNAKGNNGGAPKENQNARKHGLYSKHMPKEVYNIFNNIDDMDSIEILRDSIKLKFSNILNIQKSMKEGKGLANLIKAEAVATSELRMMIKQYEELIEDRAEQTTKEKDLKIEKLKEEIRYIRNKANLLQANKKDTSLLESLIKVMEED